MKKFLIVNNIPTPYREFMFTKMYELGRDFGIDVKVVFQAKQDPDRPWKAEDFSYSYPHYFSKGIISKKKTQENMSYYVINSDIIKDIASGEYEWALLAPFLSITHWIASFTPTKTRKILWSESNLQSTRYLNLFSRFIKSAAIKNFDALACPGIRAVEYLIDLAPSLNSRPWLQLPNIVDTSKFSREALSLKSQRLLLRERHNIEKDTICIFSIGRFIEIKGFSRALNALENVNGNYIYFLAGNGPERSYYEDIIKAKNLQSRVRLLGQISEDEVAQWLSLADWFFHPAQKDPSPLVVIEALNAGLPIAVSLQTGNCPEAVEDGRNGFIFNAYEDEDIARAFEKIIRTPLEEREKMGQSSLGKAKINFDPEIVLSSFYENLLKLP